LRRLTLRRELASPETVSRVEEEFGRLAEYKGKSFVMAKPKLV
jgi:hypothetical protein